jgi:hypothetical protein
VAADADLEAMAQDELRRALELSWRALKRVTPWGDDFEGISPSGRNVVVERSYVWASEPGGAILCEVRVYPNAALYDHAAVVSAVIAPA